MSIIINWKSKSQTAECIDHLLHLQHSPQILLLDNESTDSSWRFFQERYENRISMVRSATNLGYAGGMNLAIDHALALGCSHFFVLNNDIELNADFFSVMRSAVEGSDFDLLGPIVKTAHGEEFAGARWPEMLYSSRSLVPEKRPYRSAYVEGSAMLFSRAFAEQRIKQVGYFFDPDFFMYCEDGDLGIWANSQAMKVYIVPDAIVLHRRSSSLGEFSPIKFYYLTRNRIRLASKHLGWQQVIFYVYFFLSRILLIFSRYIFRPKIQRAILSGLYDSICGTYGKWRRH